MFTSAYYFVLNRNCNQFLFRKTVSKLLVVLGDHNNEEEEDGEEERLVDQVVLK